MPFLSRAAATKRSGFAPFDSRNSAIPQWSAQASAVGKLHRAASLSGVTPSWSSALTSAPLFRRSSATSTRALPAAAQCSGVRAKRSLAFASEPWNSSAATTSR